MNIQKIKISDAGMKGLIITHLVQEIKDGHHFMTPTKSEPKYPIHLGMEKKFKELREHLLNVCEICQHPRDEDEFTYATNEVDIIEIETSSEGFRLKGNKRMTDTKVIGLKTYFVEKEDGYAKFDEVQKIISEILVEVSEYVAGNKQISSEELGERWIANLIKKGKKGAEDLLEFQEMSAEGKEEFCKKFLMDNGAIDIVMADDLDLPDDTKVIQLEQKQA